MKKTFSRPLRAFGGLLTGLAIAACGPGGPDEPQPPEDEPTVRYGECQSDAECPSDRRCEQELCVVPVTETTLRYGLTILPSSASRIAPQTIAPQAWPVGGAMVDVEALITIDLSIEGLSPDRSATLVAIPENTVSEAQSQVSVREGRATLTLARGDYAILLVPDSSELPRYDLGTLAAREDGERTLEVPATSELREIRGTLVRQSGLPLDLLDLPVGGARVIGIDPDSRQTTSSALSNALGEFTLRVPDDGRSYDLHVSPAQTDDLIPVAIFEDAIGPETTGGRFHLGSWLIELLQLEVQLQGPPDAEPEDWSAYSLMARAPLGIGELQRPLPVDGEGRARASLLTGTYTLEVRPPAESALEATSTEVNLLDGLSATLELDARPSLSGRVVTNEGDPIASARLRLEHLQRSDFSRSIATLEDGSWAARIPAGDYRATIVPPANLGQPRQVETFSASDQSPTLLWRLEAPAIVRGQLVHPQHDTGAITVQLTHPDLGDVLAEGRTDSAGRYQLIVPAPALEALR
ncbi:carboxypeptidase regulatory-like domain-containing protein [Lujinxingia vulgaris]|uniref:Carboxypeptidase regulatory-like domain-containing protein n=1 Tax=Lujinxingia vulgaris TaxID=2600176 RepID=A0A5C6X8I7_9DELT|nr:carboxypeptidase-like regulatory domain-containing protein [Lujinxingia vulgaris]TXD37658.1 carboxypeptidase regulatory-like domain-containing protein [Lujinxingia vulgaris]